MSERCTKCLRPVQTCYCKYITPVSTGVKFVFLMHPHEAYSQRTGTGRLASLSLNDSEIIVDKSFDSNIRTQDLISNSDYFAMVLYPGKTAQPAENFFLKDEMNGKKLLVFLIDATWTMARKMMFKSQSLQTLPRLTFEREYKSDFRIKAQPEDFCLSTIESSYYLIKELQQSGVCDALLDIEGLMEVFQRMVNFQIECKDRRLELNSESLHSGSPCL